MDLAERDFLPRDLVVDVFGIAKFRESVFDPSYRILDFHVFRITFMYDDFYKRNATYIIPRTLARAFTEPVF